MHRTRFTTAVVAAVAAATLTGCGGGGQDAAAVASAPTDAAVAPSGTAAAAEPAVATSGVTATSRSVGRTVHFGAWKITVDTVHVEPGTSAYSGPTVTLDMTVANKGHQLGEPDLQLDLASGDHHWQPTGNQTPPSVPGLAQNAMKVSFTVDENFAIDDAVLTVGSAAQVRSTVPLGDGGTLVANAPQPVSIDATCSSGPVTQHITAGTLLTGLPEIDTQAEATKRYLVLDIDVTNHSTKKTPYGDVVVGGEPDYALKEPSGDSVTLYDTADSYGDMPVATIRPGDTAHTQQVYTIDAPTSGSYEWTYTYSDGSSGDDAKPGSCTFVLPGDGPSPTS